MDTYKQEFSSVQNQAWQESARSRTSVQILFHNRRKIKDISHMEYAYNSILWATRKNMLILRNSVSAIRIHMSLYIHIHAFMQAKIKTGMWPYQTLELAVQGQVT